LSFGFGCSARSSAKAHLPMSARFHARAPARYPASYTNRSAGADRPRPLSCRLSAAGLRFLGILYPPGTWAFVTSGLPPPTNGVADPDGVSVFRTHETRLGLGAPCTPGTVVSTRPHSILGRHRPPSNGPAPCHPGFSDPPQDVQLTRHQRGFTGIHPMPSLPLACGPRTERGLLGFP
jgi:hypothetical protein